MKNNQVNDFKDNKLTRIDSITVNRSPTLDNGVANKKYIDDSIGEGALLRFIQPLQNYIKVSVGYDSYILTKHVEI